MLMLIGTLAMALTVQQATAIGHSEAACLGEVHQDDTEDEALQHTHHAKRCYPVAYAIVAPVGVVLDINNGISIFGPAADEAPPVNSGRSKHFRPPRFICAAIATRPTQPYFGAQSHERQYRMRTMKRRNFLGLLPMGIAAATLPTIKSARAQSLWDMMNQNRSLSDAEREANSAAAIQAIDTVEPILSYDTANNLQMAIAQYEPFVASGGWEQVPQETYGVTIGVARDGVIQLKRRLLSSADMAMVERVDDVMDAPTDAALRRFQARHGLHVSGQVDEATWYALNVPAETRLHQLRLNLLRVQNMVSELADRYVVVNIPAAFIEVVEGGMVQRRHTAVVGRIDRQTPILKSRIHQINFNPYWNVPVSIIRRDLIKYMNENPNYLTEQKIRIFDGSGNELQPSQINWQTEEAVNYSFRQDPGPLNSMGNVKINFHNPHAVYLHDTPTKGLFGENARFYSSGCVRVDQVQDFVAWVLRDNGDWGPSDIQTVFATGERKDVDVSSPPEIHTTYISAWANRNGVVSFRDDIYEFDMAGKVTFET
ncbi:L,D-transpeptidase family protein [Devosia sp. PTEAB7WZ]|uniref:L,D-transpeptidase family protein n=1 Tax=Devosia polycyclovorans TaxID=3345148 RepID=UPI001402DAC9